MRWFELNEYFVLFAYKVAVHYNTCFARCIFSSSKLSIYSVSADEALIEQKNDPGRTTEDWRPFVLASRLLKKIYNNFINVFGDMPMFCPVGVLVLGSRWSITQNAAPYILRQIKLARKEAACNLAFSSRKESLATTHYNVLNECWNIIPIGETKKWRLRHKSLPNQNCFRVFS